MWIQAGAPNQRAINLRLVEQCAGVFRFYATSIQNAQGIGHWPAHQARHLAADDEMRLGGDCWARRLSRSDGPDGFIGADHRTQFRRLDLADRAADLPAHDLSRQATLPLFLVLTNANNRHQVMFEGSDQLPVDVIVALGEILATL